MAQQRIDQPATALATRHSGQSPALLQPADTGETVNQLSACLALVRPVGMGDDAAHEWLTVAATTLRDLPIDILAEAAEKARKTCTHHGQIVPTIVEIAGDWLAMRQRLARPARIPAERRIERERWTPDRAEIEEIKRQAAERLKADANW